MGQVVHLASRRRVARSGRAAVALAAQAELERREHLAQGAFAWCLLVAAVLASTLQFVGP